MIPIFRGLKEPGRVLRNIIEEMDIIVAPGVYNPISALIVEKMGFKAAYLSGAALTGSLGIPDIGIITLDELAYFVREITSKIRIPLIVDADTGFGEVMNVGRTVRILEQMGAAAIQIEDQVLPKKCGHLSGKRLISMVDMVRKIRIAKNASKDILIVARTDARGVEGMDEAIERALAYMDAGADIIFPEALISGDEFKEFASKVDAPLIANMTEFGKTPYFSVEEFRDWGYKIVIFPATSFRASVKSMMEVYRELMERGTQRHILDRLATREEVYDIIEYDLYESLDKELSSE
jgi:methylisocitrate lyase